MTTTTIATAPRMRTRTTTMETARRVMTTMMTLVAATAMTGAAYNNQLKLVAPQEMAAAVAAVVEARRQCWRRQC